MADRLCADKLRLQQILLTGAEEILCGSVVAARYRAQQALWFRISILLRRTQERLAYALALGLLL